MEKKKRSISTLYGYIVGAVISALAPTVFARDAIEQGDAPPNASFLAQSFKPVRVKNRFVPQYPAEALKDGEEGWVQLGFMVSSAGTPYEIYVADSSGNRVLERTALDAMKLWTFEPAQENGNAVDSATCMRMNFVFKKGQGLDGARPEFISAFRSLNKALDAHERDSSDKELKQLHVTTIYEDAFYGYAQYRYAAEWGTEDQQIAGLRRAVADELEPRFLPDLLFKTSLRSLFLLEAKADDFAGAMTTWNRLKNVETDQSKLAGLAPIVAKMQSLQNDATAYKIVGEISESSWGIRLFKRRFHVAVSSGHLSQVKLWCDTKFVSFPFDARLEYHVADGYGECSMRLIGDPGTKFELVQM